MIKKESKLLASRYETTPLVCKGTGDYCVPSAQLRRRTPVTEGVYEAEGCDRNTMLGVVVGVYTVYNT